jgi:hypothetical protein
MTFSSGLLGTQMPLELQYALAMLCLALLHAVADRRYISAWKGPPGLPRLAQCSCQKKAEIPEGKTFVICPQCRGLVDRYEFPVYTCLMLAVPFVGLGGLFVTSARCQDLLDKRVVEETFAFLMVMSLSATVLRFFFQYCAGISRRLSKDVKRNTELNSERMARYTAHKARRRTEDQLFSYDHGSEPSVLSSHEQVTLQFFISAVLAPFMSALFGAWAGLIPVIVIGWVTFFTTKPIEYILLYGWALPWAKPDSRAHAVAGLVEALKKETDLDKCQVILQSLRDLDRQREQETADAKEEEVTNEGEEEDEGDTAATSPVEAGALRAELDELKAQLALLKGREVKIKT